jgi:hypothetical protein
LPWDAETQKAKATEARKELTEAQKAKFAKWDEEVRKLSELQNIGDGI